MNARPNFTTLMAALLAAASPLAWPQNPPPATRTIEASVSVKPAAPKMGENILEVSFVEASKPVTGLKLTASVGMTNMDMGTAHPAVKETTPGHYVLKPTFSMDGPWRVTLVSKEPKFRVSFDMDAGAKEPWQAAKQRITITGVEPAVQEAVKQDPPPANQNYGHDMPGMGHSAASLPQLKERTSYVWTGAEEWDTRTGFGKFEPMVRMMILMMVGGSGFEGMKMAPMDMVFNDATFTEGGDQPMKDMPGMNSDALKVEAKLAKPSVGDNNVAITITTPDGKPVEKANITASVGMTNMDMGTAHPVVKDLGNGKYALKANFSMMGPWRLTLIVVAPGMQPLTYNFDFEAK